VELIILLAALAALAWAILRSPAASFVQVYVPVLLLAPMTYQLKLRQLPELTFDRAAVLGVTVMALLVEPLQWKVTVLDPLILLFVAGTVTSEFLNNGWTPAQSLLFYMICTVVLPYILAKHFLADRARAASFGRVLVLTLAAVALVSVVEFRLGINIFRHGWGLLFPGQADPFIFVQYRWGYGRVAGPFEHAIFCGMAMGTGLVLQIWLRDVEAWKSTIFRNITWILTGALAAGLLMTISRGPWLATAIGLAIASIPRIMSDWKRGLQWMLLLTLLGALVYAAGLARYTDPGQPQSALAEDQISVAYRAELYDHYRPLLEAKPWVGYGTITWPKAHGMRSVDNAYLQLALSYGLAGLAPFVVLLLLGGCRLLAAALAGRPLLWALLGVEALFVVNMFSVFLGNQLWPLLFVVFGWSEAAILAARASAVAAARVAVRASPTPRAPVPVT